MDNIHTGEIYENEILEQELVLGQAAFHLNDLELWVNNKSAKNVCVTKVFRVIKLKTNKQKDCKGLQKYIWKYYEWILKYKGGFNVAKCKEMHDSSKNQNFTSTLMGFDLAVTDQGRDLRAWYIYYTAQWNVQFVHACCKKAKFHA